MALNDDETTKASNNSHRTRDEIFDILGMRMVVVPRINEDGAIAACYHLKTLAEDLFEPVIGRTRDYIQNPKDNGYMSLHMTMEIGRTMINTELREFQNEYMKNKREMKYTNKRNMMMYRNEDVYFKFSEDEIERCLIELCNKERLLDSTVENNIINKESDSMEHNVEAHNLIDDDDILTLESRYIENGLFFELQIRTSAMDTEARVGTSAHPLYKYGFDLPQFSLINSTIPNITSSSSSSNSIDRKLEN